MDRADWVAVARVIYAQVVSLRERGFVEAAQAVGASGSRILRRHIVPHLLPTALVWGSLGNRRAGAVPGVAAGNLGGAEAWALA